MNLDKQKQIYILSANQATVGAIHKILRDFGYTQITTMDNGIVALPKMVEGPCDFIICDMSVKYISGWSLIKEIKNSNDIPNIPTVLLGQEPPPASEAELKGYGIVKYLQAPYSGGDIAFLMNSTLLLFHSSGTTESKYTLAKAALLKKDTQAAIEQYAELNSITNRSTRSSIGLAEAHMQNNDLKNAEAALQHMANDEVLSPSSAMMKMKILLEKNQAAEAKVVLDGMIERQVSQAPFYFSKSLALFMGYNEFAIAAEISSAAIARGFAIHEFFLGLAKAQYFQNAFPETIETLLKAEQTFGLDHELLNLRGICLKKIGDYPNAIAAYEKALELSPMDAKVYYNLASCSIAMKDYHQALSYLESCVAIAPHLAKAQEKLVEVKTYLEKVGDP